MASDIEAVAKSIQALTRHYRTLHEKCRGLISELDGHTSSVLHHIDKIKKKLGVSSKNLCTICLESDIDHIVSPCSHTYCEACATKCRAQRACFTCRAPVRSTQKIYLD